MSRACPKCGSQFGDEVFFCGYDGTITVEEQDPADFDPRLGQRLGDYIVVARVADGSMGRVYEGRHPDTKARVAIKVLHADVAKSEVAVERFKREFETADSLDHPYIVKVIEFGPTEDDSHFMTMEFLDGAELSEVLRTDAPLSPARTVRIASQLCEALGYAHSFGVIHRDLKPDNIFVCPTAEGDVVRILDFGSVKLQMSTGPKLTAMGTTLGSPYYMSPEQAMGKLDLDQRSDVFATTAILYEMATASIAFDGANIGEILTKIMQHHPPSVREQNPDYPPVFDEVIQHGVDKDKSLRIVDMKELGDSLCRAFGIDLDIGRWATMPVAAVAQHLESATPPQSGGFRPSEPVAPTIASTAPPEPYRESEMPELIMRRSPWSRWVPIGVAVAALLMAAYWFANGR